MLKYKIKYIFYKYLSNILFGKYKLLYKDKYIKYKNKNYTNDYLSNLNSITNEIQVLKQLLFDLILFNRESTNPQISIKLKEVLSEIDLNYSTSSYIQNTISNDYYIESQLRLLERLPSYIVNKDLYLDIIKDIYVRANKIKRIEVLQTAINTLNQYSYLTTTLDKLYSFVKLDIEDGIHNTYILGAYICHLLHIEDEDLAKKYLKIYVDNYGLSELSTFLPVANFALRNNIINDDIILASKIFDNFKKNEETNYFENYIRGKKVAIVGNGPQELGTNNGSLIDSYDEIIRFNDFSDDERFINDYGQKTTIWSKNGVIINRIIPELNVNITRLNYWNMPIGYKLNDYKYYFENNKEFVYVPDSVWLDLYKKYGIDCPTGGLQMIYWIKKINPNFSMDDCFGFSFKKNGSQEQFNKHYYNKGCDSGHNFDKEFEVINKILNNN